MAVKGRRIRLLTIVGPGGSEDVAVAADASLVWLLPVFVDLVGGGEANPSNPRWGLYTEEGLVLKRTQSLIAQGIADGQKLILATAVPKIGVRTFEPTSSEEA